MHSHLRGEKNHEKLHYTEIQLTYTEQIKNNKK